MKKEETPLHEHDCDNCVFLGRWVSQFYAPKLETDLYFCSGGIGGWTVICRFGEYGDYASGPRIVDASVKARMKDVLDDIQSGRFVKDWMTECSAGQPSFKAMRRRAAEHQIEEIGEKLRGMMPWISENALVDKSKN